jgi:GNAT superfamily N-acetyltransferase
MKYVENDSDLFADELGLNLHQYNRENCDYINRNSDGEHNNKKVINIAVYDEDKLIGGASGWFQFSWYYLDQIWIQKDYRKSGVGSELIKRIEQICRKKDCIGIKTETWSFQARGFYEKQGFEVYAELKDFPPGAVEYYLKKRF